MHSHAAATTIDENATTIDGDCQYLQTKKQRVDGPQGLSQKFADNPSILTQCHKLNTIHVDWVKIEEYLLSRFNLVKLWVSRRFVRMDVLSGRRFVRTALDALSGRRFVRTALDVLSGRTCLRRFVRKTFCQDRLRRFVRKTFCQDRLMGGHILGISWAYLWNI